MTQLIETEIGTVAQDWNVENALRRDLQFLRFDILDKLAVQPIVVLTRQLSAIRIELPSVEDFRSPQGSD